MAFNKAKLKTDLISIFNNADKETNIEAVAEQMANAIDSYAKSGKATGADSRGDTHNLNLV